MKKRIYKKKLKTIKPAVGGVGRLPNAVKEIFKKFIYPLQGSAKHGPEAQSELSNLFNLFFNAQSRSLGWYRTTEEFVLPGEKYVAGNKTVPGVGARNLKTNELLLVVEDDALDYIKVEVCRPKSETNYKLTVHEWNFVKQKIRKI